MDLEKASGDLHPEGESIEPRAEGDSYPCKVNTFGGLVHVEWDPQAPVTALGQLVFFIEFLKTAELFAPWVTDCPLTYKSPNAPSKCDVLGSILLSVLAGHNRYAHVSALRADTVNPGLLGMEKVLSEDSVRRAFLNQDEPACARWMKTHLGLCYGPLLYEPWILDVDTRVKSLYGKQEGAVKGYNPHKPGRPSHTYHTYFLSNLRLVIDVDVQPGNRTAACYTMPGLWDFLDNLDRQAWPALIRGDCAFGNELVMVEAEQRSLNYLFKLRQTKRVKQLIERLFWDSEWVQTQQGWQGAEAQLKLQGWSRERRVIVLRRRLKQVLVVSQTPEGQSQMTFVEDPPETSLYEYAILVTSLGHEILTLAQMYRDRADCENAFDELSNQWGWGGFTTKDLARCRVMARIIALVYNWWSLFVRLASRDHHVEAVTTRPLLLHAIGRQTTSGRQTTIVLTNTHSRADQVRRLMSVISMVLHEIRKAAEQLSRVDRWRLLLSKIFAKLLGGRQLRLPKPLLNSS